MERFVCRLRPGQTAGATQSLAGACLPELDRLRIAPRVGGRSVKLGEERLVGPVRGLHHLKDALAAIDDTPQPGVRAGRAVEWLRVLAETWTLADVPEAKAELLHAIYERIVVAGRRIASVRLTPTAYANGLALALPEKVAMARPTGVAPSRTHADFRLIPVDGANDWGADLPSSA